VDEIGGVIAPEVRLYKASVAREGVALVLGVEGEGVVFEGLERLQ
jgi:hypothetical protein